MKLFPARSLELSFFFREHGRVPHHNHAHKRRGESRQLRPLPREYRAHFAISPVSTRPIPPSLHSVFSRFIRNHIDKIIAHLIPYVFHQPDIPGRVYFAPAPERDQSFANPLTSMAYIPVVPNKFPRQFRGLFALVLYRINFGLPRGAVNQLTLVQFVQKIPVCSQSEDIFSES